jgi:hypothetical protein
MTNLQPSAFLTQSITVPTLTVADPAVTAAFAEHTVQKIDQIVGILNRAYTIGWNVTKPSVDQIRNSYRDAHTLINVLSSLNVITTNEWMTLNRELTAATNNCNDRRRADINRVAQIKAADRLDRQLRKNAKAQAAANAKPITIA